tara:strand:- start:535 stop:1272 length:738 start_codon:yes stop_codon:yes gene_type:complete
MNKTAIIIPSRLDAQRLPNKPLKLINNKEMILHVYEAAKKSHAGEVFIATPDEKIMEVVKKYGGNVIKTSVDHKTGTDRIYEVFEKNLNREPDIIVNLQGDMPNIDPKAIKDLIDYMQHKKCEIGTLASELTTVSELEDKNIVKVITKEKLKYNKFARALDFVRIIPSYNNEVYHHVGIYAFTNEALVRYVRLERSKLEIKRNLEQLRAMENEMSIHVGFINSSPLSVDTEKDLAEIQRLMKNND